MWSVMPTDRQRCEKKMVDGLGVKRTREALNYASAMGEAAPPDAVSWGNVIAFLSSMTRRVVFLEMTLRAIVPSFEEALARLDRAVGSVEADGTDLWDSCNVPALLLGQTPKLLRLIVVAIKTGNVHAGCKLMASVLTSPLAVSPAAGPVPHDVVEAIFAIDEPAWSKCPGNYAALLFAVAVAFADAPDAETNAERLVQRVLQLVDHLVVQRSIMDRRVVGLVAFLVFR